MDYKKLRLGCDVRNRYEKAKANSPYENQVRLNELQLTLNQLSKGIHTRTILFHRIEMYQQIIKEQENEK